MKTVRPWIAYILFQLACVAAVWFLSTAEQQAQYLVWLGVTPSQEKPPERSLLNLRAIPQLTARREVDQPYQCSPKTRSISATKQNGVYKWVDEKGKTHFSDKAPVKTESENLTQQYSNRYQYFTIEVQQRGGSLPAYMKDHLSADTRQIFNIIANQLKISQLRQINLQMYVFDYRTTFNQFARRIAPSVGDDISGFYSSGHNLAAVMRQGSDKATFATARHEATRVIISGLFGNIPTWFTEGMAEYFEQMSISFQLKTIAPNRSWLTLLQGRQKNNQSMSLNQYFRYDLQS